MGDEEQSVNVKQCSVVSWYVLSEYAYLLPRYAWMGVLFEEGRDFG